MLSIKVIKVMYVEWRFRNPNWYENSIWYPSTIISLLHMIVFKDLWHSVQQQQQSVIVENVWVIILQ